MHQKEHHPLGGVLFGLLREMGLERPLRKHAGGMFLGRGRVLLFSDASRRDVDENRYPYMTALPNHDNQALQKLPEYVLMDISSRKERSV